MIFDSIDSTIFALATPRMPSGRAILRISGYETFDIVAKLFVCDSGASIKDCNSSTAISGYICLCENLKVRGYCWKFNKPATYTGQDIAELHFISSPVLIRLIEQKCIELGCIAAKAGEFTARAFLNGRIDLTQAQAIRMLTEAQNDAQIDSAINMLEGKFHNLLTDEYEKLRELVSRVEANIDFSEEQIELIGAEELISCTDELLNRLEKLLQASVDRKQIEYLPRVFIVGCANAGKSTLMNRLTRLERVICSPLAGTTRDVISAVWNWKNMELLLCDTVGLLDNVAEQINAKSLEHTNDMLKLADMFIIVLDSTGDIAQQVQLIRKYDVHENKAVIVLNKIDVIDTQKIQKKLLYTKKYYEAKNILAISAEHETNLDKLAELVFSELQTRSITIAQGHVALDERMRELLHQAICSLKDAKRDAIEIFQQDTNATLGLEIVAESLSHSLRAIGALLGKDITEDVLENIFNEFCIGK